MIENSLKEVIIIFSTKLVIMGGFKMSFLKMNL